MEKIRYILDNGRQEGTIIGDRRDDHWGQKGRSLGTGRRFHCSDHWGQADVFIVASIVERCLNFGCFDLAKTNYDEPFVRDDHRGPGRSLATEP